MGEMTIRLSDEDLQRRLVETALRIGRDPETLAVDLVTYQLSAGQKIPNSPLQEADTLTAEERGRRQQLRTELRDIRALTLKPMVLNSTLLIREMRDHDD